MISYERISFPYRYMHSFLLVPVFYREENLTVNILILEFKENMKSQINQVTNIFGAPNINYAKNSKRVVGR